MENSPLSAVALLLLGATLLLIQHLPNEYWSLATRLLPVSHISSGAGALAWREWQEHRLATRAAMLASGQRPAR